ncbi:GntR family transcriptional regulator/MocR family aminotransferase [Agromyces sp. 3263]|uniref:MocR-like pyridoxine biosynthesis transcription factor PdxR n=1 Tax=Agromyces sp. 3263 TaxID=2817750 RepID=UPI002864E6FE|nr:PLP-dependent aminotransferase family protein [Agromyces sp. 3263]MDR6905732.1 GntR family transcriptional regulator/MocR family aminotransferase [Agromyces sp. 3263]
MDGPIPEIDRNTGRPLGMQLVEGVRRRILEGVLRPGDAVPSTRALASELAVSRSAVVAAYEQLAGEGYLDMRQGAPTRVAALLLAGSPPTDGLDGGRHDESVTPNGRELRVPAAATRTSRPLDGMTARVTADGSAAQSAGAPPRIDLLPGRPSTARIDTRAWRAAWRHAAGLDIPSESPPPFGVARLRAEIADHLRLARGVARAPDDVVVTAGTAEALALVASALAELIGTAPEVAVEHPGYPSARRTLERRGARTTPVPVDGDGIDVDALRRMPRPPHAVMVTPSHQYPLGGRLPVAARLELLDWARAAGAVVIEDDYDSEFRHLGPPLPALASLDDERVVLVGSFSKVLTPWLRLGYLVLPADPALREAVAAIRADEPSPVPGTAQEAAAALLASGAVRRHIAVTRREYAHRRRLVLAALDGLPGAPLSGLDGGLHAVLGLPDAATAASVVDRLAAEGVAVASLAEYSAVPGDERAGLVFGYAGPTDTLLAEGLERIRAAVASAI